MRARRRERLALIGAVALVAAMLGRMGWVDWGAVLAVVLLGSMALLDVAALLLVAVVLPSLFLWALFILARAAVRAIAGGGGVRRAG